MADCQGKIVEIKPGHTVSRYKTAGRSLADIKSANPDLDLNNILAGQKICVPDVKGGNVDRLEKKEPAKKPETAQPKPAANGKPAEQSPKASSCTGNEAKHKVEAGDTLSTIAEKHKTTEKGLLAANPKIDPKNKVVMFGTFIKTIAPEPKVAEEVEAKPEAKTEVKQEVKPEVKQEAAKPVAQVQTPAPEPVAAAPAKQEMAEASQSARDSSSSPIQEQPTEEPSLLGKLYNLFFGSNDKSRVEQINEPLSAETVQKIQEKKAEMISQMKQFSQEDMTKLEEYSAVLPFIKFKEASGDPKLKAYLCQAGIITAGYGSTNVKYNGKKLKVGDEITRDFAENLFAQDILKRIKSLETEMPKDLPQNVKDTVLSLSYNAGVSGALRSKFFESIKKGDLKDTSNT